jgi:hypothetical protein
MHSEARSAVCLAAQQSNWELERAVLNRKIADVAAEQKQKQSQMVELATKVRVFTYLEPHCVGAFHPNLNRWDNGLRVHRSCTSTKSSCCIPTKLDTRLCFRRTNTTRRSSG